MNNSGYLVMNGSSTASVVDSGLNYNQVVNFVDSAHSWNISKNGKGSSINPIFYFKYVKEKFTLIERAKLKRKIAELEKAVKQAHENGQELMAEKFATALLVASKEMLLSVKGVTKWIDRETLHKFKHKIRDGHISDTKLKDYTRVIPKGVLKKKAKSEGLFDDYVIYHYWNPDAKDLKNMGPEEKAKMKDPILFGTFKGSDRLYLIADWDDEYCDLSFDEIAKAVTKEGYSTGKIGKAVL